MEPSDLLRRGRESFARQSWAEAYDQLTAADAGTPLEPPDLERLAATAWLFGRDSAAIEHWTRAHHTLLDRDEVERAARCAFWLGFSLMSRGEHARGGGWIARGRRLLGDVAHQCVEQGYLLLPSALEALGRGDGAQAYDTFGRAAAVGERFGDADLTTLARLGSGQSLIRSGAVRDGVTLLDEVMVSVGHDDVSPIIVGTVYCAVLSSCHEIYDLRRAQEWTAALSDWCESQPDLAPFRGPCLVRRSEIMQIHGAWAEAAEEARRACDRLTNSQGDAAAGAAFYQRAELHRLRGELDEAEAAYREASRWGREPEPGLALLRLARGQLDAARSAIHRVADEARNRRTRSRVLPAFVDIMLSAGDVDAARTGADELTRIAAELDAPLLRATADHARGAVLLAGGDARAALEALRAAWAAWDEMEAPYEAARVRLLIGVACRELGDGDGAELEFAAARAVFEQVGAAPDLRRLDGITGSRDTDSSAGSARGSVYGLTRRELQVLRSVAEGRTNRDIAATLFISERTVERHVSNILRKLGVVTRAAATAFAYEHQLV